MEIVTKDGFTAIVSNTSAVAVLLYTIDDKKALDKIGVVTETNPFFPDSKYTGAILGTVETDDSSLLERAKKEAKEESGYEIDNSKWIYLGELFTSKMFPNAIYCYAADITDMNQESKPKGDGSQQEKGIDFKLIEINKLSDIQDSVVQSLFIKLFSHLYKNQV